jgi:hypothetical protein
MKCKTYLLRTCGSSKKVLYEYPQRWVFPKENIADLVILLGAENVCLLLKYFSGTHLYIPGIKSIKRRIVEAAMVSEAERLKKEGKNRQQIINEITENFKGYWTRKALENKLVKVFSKKEDVKEESIKTAQRETLLSEVARYREVFRAYGLVE